MVSDKAAACVGCGAPLAPPVQSNRFRIFNLVPEPSKSPPPTRNALRWRAILCALSFVLGVVWSAALEHHSAGGRPAATLAALLVIVGLCGVIVTAVQFPSARK